jgi:hypothetical protein
VLAQFDSAALEAVARASKRSSALVHEEMREGVYSLATVASVAPWVGLFGTILGIVNSFQGFSGPRFTIMAAICQRLSESMWPTGLGLLVGMIALWSYEYLAGELSALDREMRNASLELLNQLSRFQGRFTSNLVQIPSIESPMFGEKPLAELSREDKALRHSMILTGTMLPLAWCALAARYFGRYAVPWDTAVLLACFYIPILFGASCLFAYPIWIKLLHLRPGGLAALGSTICLAWTFAEFLLGRALP